MLPSSLFQQVLCESLVPLPNSNQTKSGFSSGLGCYRSIMVCTPWRKGGNYLSFAYAMFRITSEHGVLAGVALGLSQQFLSFSWRVWT
jgi:hypothetical protein